MLPGERLEVVRAVDRRAVVDVVGARDDDGPDLRDRQPLQLGRDALHGPARLDVRVEQVAGDQEEVDLLGDGEIAVALNAANWRSRWAAACSPRSS